MNALCFTEQRITYVKAICYLVFDTDIIISHFVPLYISFCAFIYLISCLFATLSQDMDWIREC